VPRLRLKRLLQLSLIVTILGTGAVFAFALHHGKRLASPERRTLQNYHLEYFENADQHGIRIEKRACLNGKVPCLVVSPDSTASLGERGKLIRGQIESLPVVPGEIIGNVVLLHGRNGRKEDLLPVAERFCAVGLRCIIPDLPAHGESPIQASQFGLDKWEKQLPASVLEECSRHFDFAPQPCALWGISMGGSFATSAASANDSPWNCLTIVSSFDRLDHVIENKCHSATLADFVSGICERNGGAKLSDVRPVQWAASVELPVLVAHGTEDELIGLNAGRKLFASFPTKEKHWVEVEGGTHSGVLTTAMPLYARMADWILKHTLSPAPE